MVTQLQALIGQKYGYRPFPPTIAADEFETIRQELNGDRQGAATAAATLLDTWFKKNTNVIPHVYCLQPISTLLPDYARGVSSKLFAQSQCHT